MLSSVGAPDKRVDDPHLQLYKSSEEVLVCRPLR